MPARLLLSANGRDLPEPVQLPSAAGLLEAKRGHSISPVLQWILTYQYTKLGPASILPTTTLRTFNR